MPRTSAALALVACCLGCARPQDRPAPPPPAPAPSPLVAHASPTPSAAASATAPAAPQPLVLEHGEDFRAHPSGATMSVFARGKLGASFSPDKRHVLLVPGKRGAELRKLDARTSVNLDAGYVTRSAFSPDSRFVALAQEGGKIRLFEVASGARTAELTGDEPRFAGSARLAWRQGCDGWVLDLPLSTPPRKLGSACGDLLHASDAFDTWIVSERAPFRRGVLQAHAAIRRVHLASGSTSELLRVPADHGLFEPVVSPNGDRLCVLDDVFALKCTTLAGGLVLQRIWPSSVLRNPEFDESGTKILFGVGRSEHAERDVYVADLAAGKLRKLVRAKHEWWSFLPGGERIVGHGGDEKLTVFDLASGLRIEIGKRGEEWEGLTIVPGDPTQILVGRERGASRDLWLVKLPS